MMHPTLQVREEIYIHAACAAIWSRFTRVSDWPSWRTDSSHATWQQGQTWQEGAQFTLQERGTASPVTYIIRMVVGGDTTVWESSQTGNQSDPGVVYSIHLVEQVGGCKVSLHATFHGWGSLLKRLASSREKAKLHAILVDLKAVMERGGGR